MRLIFCGLMILALGCAAAAPAAGAGVEGTAALVDRERGRIKVLESGTMRVVTVMARPALWPPGLTQGSRVRVSGRFSREQPQLLHADRVSLVAPTGKGDDPTGVRSRLNRGRGKRPF